MRISDWSSDVCSSDLKGDRKKGMSGAVNVTRFKGLGEMNPSQLRESTIHPDTRRRVQLTIDAADQTRSLMDMLLARKRARDRNALIEENSDQATLEVNPGQSTACSRGDGGVTPAASPPATGG